MAVNLITLGFMLAVAYVLGMMHSSTVNRRRDGESWNQILLSESNYRKKARELKAKTVLASVIPDKVHEPTTPITVPRMTEAEEASVEIREPIAPYIDLEISPVTPAEIETIVPVPIPVQAPDLGPAPNETVDPVPMPEPVYEPTPETVPMPETQPPVMETGEAIVAQVNQLHITDPVVLEALETQRRGVLGTLNEHMVMANNSGDPERIKRLQEAMAHISDASLEMLLITGTTDATELNMSACKECQVTLVQGAIGILKDHLATATANDNTGGIKSLTAGINDLTSIPTEEIYTRGQLAERAAKAGTA